MGAEARLGSPHPSALLYTGYSAGEAPLPSPPVTVNVMDMGAKGDGTADDTKAFVAAIKAVAGGGVIYIPPGVGSR